MPYAWRYSASPDVAHNLKEHAALGSVPSLFLIAQVIHEVILLVNVPTCLLLKLLDS